MKPKRWHPELIGLIVAAFATRVWNLFSPNAVVFDEVYFKEFAAHYLDGRYYFDIHPPLGKLVLGGFARLFGLAPAEMLAGTALPLRLIPAAAGILLVPLTWGILRRLGARRPFAFLGALLVLLDNAILVESRFILMDSMLMLFGLSAVYFYLVARDTKSRWHLPLLAASALMAGAALSIKWTGLSALATVGLLWLWDQREHWGQWRRHLSELVILVLVPVMLYTAAFWMHFQLLPRSGEGDAFMSVRFQETLQGSSYYNPATRLSFFDKFTQLNVEMFRANQTLTAGHPYSSHWYTWPLELRSIYYWQGDALDSGRQGNVYLLGNPIIWWGIWVALIAGLAYMRASRTKLRPATVAALAVSGAAYLINFLPFMAVSRVMFLYHYFFSFFFSLVFVVLLWNDLATGKNGSQLQAPDHRRTYGAIILLIVLGFLFFAPLTYGTPLSPQGLQSRMWLQSWR